MAIFKRGKFYWFSFTHNGERIQKSTQQSDKESAKKLMSAERTRLSLVDAGLESPEPKTKRKGITIAELLDGLEKHYRQEGKASAGNLSTLGRARKAFGAKKALTKEDVEKYIADRLAAGAKPATVNRVTEIVRRAFKIAKHPAPEIRHLSEAGNARKGFFGAQELDTVVANLPEDLRDFTRFAFATAWRKGEIASLRWSDCEDDVIRLRGENSKNGEARQVVIDGDLVEIIKRCRAFRAVETPNGTSLCEFIFHRHGEPIAEFRKSWARACVAAKVGVMVCSKCQGEGDALSCQGCKKPTKYRGKIFHDLRRSGVRDMIRGGVPQSVAMKISGHKTASMFRRYDIASESDLRQAMLSVQKYRKAQGQKVVAMTP